MAKPTVKTPSAVKMCLSCQKTLPLTDFFRNRGWVEQNRVDLYCKVCARKMCFDKESMRKYCWENGRIFSDEMWESAEKLAMRDLINNKEWLKEKTSQKRKEQIKNQAICNRFFFVMCSPKYYGRIDTTDDNGDIRDFDPDSLDGMIVKTENGEQIINEGTKIYSSVWNGLFTKQEIAYLDSYYERLNEGFMLDDISIQDYARKVAKASLEADTRYNNMRIGKCTSKDWKEAQDAFDGMSKSANFAACQKRDKGSGTNLVLCEIIQNIEVNHQADIPKVVFDSDDIDLILADFAHTDIAIK